MHPQLAGLQRVLVLRGPAPQVEHPDALGGGGLGHPQMQDQARRVLGELRVVRGEPAGQHGARAQPEVRGDGPVGDVQHGEHSGAAGRARLVQQPDQGVDPLLGEAVPAAGPAVLRGLPLHQRAQRGRVALVEHEPHLAGLPPQLALLGEGRLEELGRLGAQHLFVRRVARADVDDGRGELLGGGTARTAPGPASRLSNSQARQRAGAQQLRGARRAPGPQDGALAVGDAQADGPAVAERPAFVREEAGGLVRPPTARPRWRRAAPGRRPG